MSEVKIKIKDDVFNPCYLPYLEDQTPLQIYFGGSSSGKSVFVVGQRAVFDLLHGGRNYLIARNVSSTLRTSVFNEIDKVITEWGLRDLFTVNKAEMTFTCRNGYQAILKGLDDPEKIKSITPKKGIITDIVIEEATETTKDAYKQLTKRLRGTTRGNIQKRVTLLFNPILKSHWIYKEFFNGWIDGVDLLRLDKILIFKTTHLNNQFLSDQDHAALEAETDEYYYNVYTLGNWGVLGDVVFTNWHVEDIKSNPDLLKTFDIFRHGLDFGFTNDPTAYNKIYYHKASKRLYILDEWNARGVTNDDISRAVRPFVGDDVIVCDSAEPKSIVELSALGVNAAGARKGKDSVNHGIQWLKQQKIIIDASCQHTRSNFEVYHWTKNKAGEVLNIPVDRDNHHIDAIRYAMEDLMLTAGDDEIEEVGDLLTAEVDW